MRIALPLSLLLTACTVGEVGTANNTMGDAGNGSNANACVDRITPPNAAHIHTAAVAVAGKPSNAGENCIKAGCHLNNSLGPNAPGYQFAGTVYAAGTTNPQAGATVRIKSGAMVLTALTDDAGNFAF